MLKILKCLIEKYKEWDHPSGIEWEPVERVVTVKGKKIRVRYEPHVKGYLRFTNEEGEPYSPTRAGAFTSMNAIWDALKDVKMDRIYYELKPTEPHFKTKEKWYAREMSRHGYELISKPRKYLASPTIHYFWRKKQGKRSASDLGGLEKAVGATTAIIGFIAGLFFLSFNITGNVIGLSQASSSWIGIILFLIGLIGAFIYFRKNR